MSFVKNEKKNLLKDFEEYLHIKFGLPPVIIKIINEYYRKMEELASFKISIASIMSSCYLIDLDILYCCGDIIDLKESKTSTPLKYQYGLPRISSYLDYHTKKQYIIKDSSLYLLEGPKIMDIDKKIPSWNFFYFSPHNKTLYIIGSERIYCIEDGKSKRKYKIPNKFHPLHDCIIENDIVIYNSFNYKNILCVYNLWERTQRKILFGNKFFYSFYSIGNNKIICVFRRKHIYDIYELDYLSGNIVEVYNLFSLDNPHIYLEDDKVICITQNSIRVFG